MPSLKKKDEDSENRSEKADFFENLLIFCPKAKDLMNRLVELHVRHPQLIVFDFSQNFYPCKIQLKPIEKIAEIYDLDSSIKFHDSISLKDLLQDMYQLFTISQSILNSNGFLAVKVNGTIKAPVKQILDSIFQQVNFMNEIIINSPLKIQYSNENAFFERTDYFLLYSVSATRKINPVYDEKESGGYWHSFVSKGQGSAKNFFINGKMISLNPPSGTHWKLRQETILRLCKKGQIRLNRNGNPEYWVPPKIGQIIDTNWLDLDITKVKNHQNSYYTRLFKVLLKPQQTIVFVNTRNSVSLVEASNFGLKWICLVEEKKILEILKSVLIHENIRYFERITEKSVDHCINMPIYSFFTDQMEKSPSSSDFHLLSPISSYPTNSSVEPPNGKKFVNKIIRGDCFHILQLLEKEYHRALKLIYIDPPFYTGYDESIYIPFQSRNHSKLIEKKNSDISIKTVAYKNVLLTNTPIKDFKCWFKQRVILMRPLLRLDGFIFIRFDYHFCHYAKEVLDEVFGQDNFVIEFIIRRMKKNLSEKQLNQQTRLIVHSDSLFVYRRSSKAKFRRELIKKSVRKGQDEAETEYVHDNLWIDIAGYQKVKRTIYPTENSEALLKRVIELSTSKGDIVADFFAGSGTTLVMAEKLERIWIGSDIGMLSINEICKRILQAKKRSPFEFHELIDKYNNLESEKDNKFEFDVRIEKYSIPHGTKVVLTLTNLVHTSSVQELQHSTFIDVIDYWEVDWYYNESIATINWHSHRKIKRKKVEKMVTISTSHEYNRLKESIIWVKVLDIFGNSCHKTFKIYLQ